MFTITFNYYKTIAYAYNCDEYCNVQNIGEKTYYYILNLKTHFTGFKKDKVMCCNFS